MRLRPLLAAVPLFLAAAAWHGHAARADSSRGGLVVARVGAREITATELARRIGQVPPFQLRTFGSTPAEVRRNFLERVVVRELLLSQAAADRHLDEREDLRDRIRTELRNQMVAAVRARAKFEHPVTPDDVKAYYAANASKFHAPARIAVWRIQVGSEKEARDVLDEMKKDPSAKHWTELARERSLDKTSFMRGGNIGFVGADGSSSEEGVHVDPPAIAAIAKAKDAEILADPVREGDRWSVLWRRQSLRAVERPLELETVPIRQILVRKQTDDAMNALLGTLRAQLVTQLRPEELDTFEVEPSGD